MPTKKYKMSNGKRGAALAIRVTPRASKNEIVEVLSDQTIKVRLTAPPVEGEANEALVKFLAEVLDVPKSKIEIVAGMSGRDKLVSIVDVDSEDVHKKILAHLA
jgi:uncharacterized protein (TIGR00251 family)